MKSVKKVCAKVKEQTLSIFKPVKNEEVVQRVNKILVGWGNYFQCGYGLWLEICAELLLRTTGNGAALASMEAEVTRYGSHTESRMRENCTYGSMRGIRRKTAKHVLRVAEGRAGVPCGGVPLYSTPFCPTIENRGRTTSVFYKLQ